MTFLGFYENLKKSRSSAGTVRKDGKQKTKLDKPQCPEGQGPFEKKWKVMSQLFKEKEIMIDVLTIPWLHNIEEDTENNIEKYEEFGTLDNMIINMYHAFHKHQAKPYGGSNLCMLPNRNVIDFKQMVMYVFGVQ